MKCNEFREEFIEFSYLWTTDINELFGDFLKTAFVDIDITDDLQKEELRMDEESFRRRGLAQRDDPARRRGEATVRRFLVAVTERFSVQDPLK